MCGRYVLHGPGEAMLEGFSLRQVPPFAPRYNIAPSTPILVVRHDRHESRVAGFMRWGLVPHWARDPSIGARLINARAEGLATKPAFRQAFRTGRCVVSANGFYEWKAVKGAGRVRRQPYYAHRPDGALIAMAGLYAWRAGSEGSERGVGASGDSEAHGTAATCCIVTTAANRTMAQVHERMPALLDRRGVDAWLDPRSDPDALAALLGPCPEDWLVLRAVAPAVGDARRDGAALIAPVPDAGDREREDR